MGEILGVVTAFGVMMGGDHMVTGPIPCDKEITTSVEELVLQDEGGKLGESISVERRQAGPQSYDVLYKVRQSDGTETLHSYRVDADKSCKSINVKRI
jgi:hypothetical protein